MDKAYKKLLEDLEFCNMALEMRPDDDNAYYNKAEVLLKLGKYDEKYFSQALDCYNRALELDPENLLALCDRAKIYSKLGQKEAAIIDLVDVRKLAQERDDDVLKLYAKKTLEVLEDLDAVHKMTNTIKLTMQQRQLNENQKNQIESFDAVALDSIKQLIVEKIATQLNIDKLKDDKKNAAEIESLKQELNKKNIEIAEIKELQSKILSCVEENKVDINKIKTDTEQLITKFDVIERILESFNARIEDGSQQLTILIEDFVHEKSNTSNIKSLLQSFVIKSAKDANMQKEQITKMQQQLDTRIDHILSLSKEEQANIPIQIIVSRLTEEINKISQTVYKHNERLDEQDIKLQELNKELKNCATLAEFLPLKEQVKSSNMILDGKITLIEGELQGQQVQILHINETLSDALIYQEVEIRKSFQSFEKTPPVYEYANTFYWTLSNYLMAYRILSTGAVQGQIEESLLEKIVSTVAKIIGTAVPTGFFQFIESTLSKIYNKYQQMKFSQKVKKINDVIALNCILEQDLTLAVAKVAVEIATRKKDVILNKAVEKSGFIDKSRKWLYETLDNALSKFTGVKTRYDSKVAKMALADVLTLIGELVKMDVVADIGNTLDQKIINIAVENDLIKLG